MDNQPYFYIVVTEELTIIPFTVDEFTGNPRLLKQLHKDQIETVGQLPKELVIWRSMRMLELGRWRKCLSS